MEDINISGSSFNRVLPDSHETVHIHPEINPATGLTGRYIVALTNPDVSFVIEIDGNKCWKCKDLPEDIDPDLVGWAGNEIERYYS